MQDKLEEIYFDKCCTKQLSDWSFRLSGVESLLYGVKATEENLQDCVGIINDVLKDHASLNNGRYGKVEAYINFSYEYKCKYCGCTTLFINDNNKDRCKSPDCCDRAIEEWNELKLAYRNRKQE